MPGKDVIDEQLGELTNDFSKVLHYGNIVHYVKIIQNSMSRIIQRIILMS